MINEDKETLINLGEQYFFEGYNCAQSVVLPFAKYLDISKENLVKITSGFGGGISRCREVCGLITGATIVLSLMYGYMTPETGEIKAKHYARVQEIVKKFQEKYHYITCYELLGKSRGIEEPIPSQRTKEFYQSRPCKNYIKSMVEILFDYISNN